ELQSVFPKARVIRLDLDVARATGRPDAADEDPQRRASTVGRLLQAFARGEADVMVGTQMIAKGLDFPRVTLVGVLDADVALHLPDFRAAERTYQLLVQVSGRAGRGERPGEVFVQTCTPDHPAVSAAALHDERLFLGPELEQRREAGYPPYVRLATLLFSGPVEAEIEAAATKTRDAILGDAEAAGVTLLGP